MRIDKYIWSIRLFKTRSLSSKACISQKVKLNDTFVKGAKVIKKNDEIEIREIPIWRVFKVLDIPKSRVGAKLVSQYVEEITPENELLKLEAILLENRQNKMLGIKGRPTKKDRRDIDNLKSLG